MNTTETQMANYWGMWGGVAATTTLRSTCPPPPLSAGGEPSWEEQAFARDAAGHLGAGCVWPPRSYTCTFCRREFRSAQALGGHMNVHRRDRARLRQCASPPEHRVQPHPTSTTIPHDHHQPADLNRAAAATLVSSPKSPKYQQAIISSTTTSPSYISTIIKESKNKSMPADATTAREAAESGDDDEERRKRRRVDLPSPPPAVALPFFVRPPASCERADGDAKVPKVITSPSPDNSIHLVGRQEVDLELRLGTSTPKVA